MFFFSWEQTGKCTQRGNTKCLLVLTKRCLSLAECVRVSEIDVPVEWFAALADVLYLHIAPHGVAALNMQREAPVCLMPTWRWSFPVYDSFPTHYTYDETQFRCSGLQQFQCLHPLGWRPSRTLSLFRVRERIRAKIKMAVASICRGRTDWCRMQMQR